MLRVERRVFESVVLQIIDSTDMRELLSEFSRDTPFFYSITSDISRGKDSPNYPIIEKIAVDRRVNEEFIVQQARSLLSLLAPERPKEDYYGILGVHPTADSREIRKSWLRLVTAYHPDRVGDEGLEITKKLNEAYDVLRDPVRRSNYDSRFPHASPVLVVEPWRTRLLGNPFSYAVIMVFLIISISSYIFLSKSPLRSGENGVGMERRVGDKGERVLLAYIRPEARGLHKGPPSDIEGSATQAVRTVRREGFNGGEGLAYMKPPPRPGATKGTEEPSEKGGKWLASKAGAEKKGVKYVVKSGDNLWGIARAFNTTVRDIKAENKLRDNRLDVGDVLIISGEGPPKRDVEKRGYKGPVGEPLEAPKKKVALKEPERKSLLPENEGEKTPSSTTDTKKLPVYPDRESLYSFVSEYVSAYKSRNMPRFVSFFAPDARENGVEISKAITSYRRNFSSLDIIQYDVRVSRVAVEDDRASIDGDFTMTFKKRSEEKVKRSRGEISWLLSWDENGWRIKEINYRLRGREADEG